MSLALIVIHRHLLTALCPTPAFLVRWDAWQFMWPRLAFLEDCLRAGIWPLWNPYDFAGAPLCGNLQTLYHQPLILAWTLIAGFDLRSFMIYQFVLYIFGAFSMYFLARQFIGSRRVAMAMAVLFSVSGFALGNAQHWPQLHLVMTEPLTLALLVRFARTGGRRSLAWAVLGTALLITAGYPSILGHLCLFNLLFIAVECRHHTPHPWRRIAGLVVIHAAALIITSPMLLPAFLSLPYITRGGGVDYATFISHSLPPVYLIGLLNPFAGLAYLPGANLDISLRNCGIGLLTIVCAGLAIRRPRFNLFLLIYLAIAILGLLGGNLATGHLFHKLPFLGNSAHVSYEFRALTIIILFLLALRGLQMEVSTKNARPILLSAAGMLLLYAFCTRIPLMLDPCLESLNIFAPWSGIESRSTWAIIIIFLPVIFIVIYHPLLIARNRPLVQTAILCAALAEALIIARCNYRTVLEPVTMSDWQACECMERERPRTFTPPAAFKRIPLHPRVEHMGALLKVNTDWGYDSTTLRSLVQLHATSNGTQRLQGPFMTLISAGGPTDANPQFTRYEPNRIALSFEPLPGDRAVHLNFMYYPGWQVSADGGSRTMYADTAGMAAVDLRRGDAMLNLQFRPPCLPWLYGISLFLIFILMCVAL